MREAMTIHTEQGMRLENVSRVRHFVPVGHTVPLRYIAAPTRVPSACNTLE